MNPSIFAGGSAYLVMEKPETEYELRERVAKERHAELMKRWSSGKVENKFEEELVDVTAELVYMRSRQMFSKERQKIMDQPWIPPSNLAPFYDKVTDKMKQLHVADYQEQSAKPFYSMICFIGKHIYGERKIAPFYPSGSGNHRYSLFSIAPPLPNNFCLAKKSDESLPQSSSTPTAT